MQYKKLWIALSAVIVISLGILGYYGWELYQVAPPVPKRVITTAGQVVFTGEQIKDGQNVWQSIGGQEVGSVWGHGAYVAPDWSADWLHREAVWILDFFAHQDFQKKFSELNSEQQAALKARLKKEIRTNTYDAASGDLTVSPLRVQAIAAVKSHYSALFMNDPAMRELRDAYAIPANTVRDPARMESMGGFFFWASWACATERPGSNVTYTQNWPPEQLIDNVPTGPTIVWSVISFVLLLAGVGSLAWYFAVKRHEDEEHGMVPERDPLLALNPTPSMRATLKYFWTVALLIVVQILLGAVAAHYGVEGSGFYGFPLDQWVPYSVARTWHTQL